MPNVNHNEMPLGPFAGGLNQLEDPHLIADDQLAICQNMDIGRAGELFIRPGLRRPVTYTNAQRVVGVSLLSNNTTRAFFRDTAVNGAIAYSDAANIISSSALTTATGGTVAGKTEKVVQYSNSAWFIPKDVQWGGSTAAQGFRYTLDTNTGSTVTAMPRGTSAVVFKDRLFIFGPVDANGAATQRVYYSAATDFTSWPAANFFDITPGDGEGVTAAVISADTLIFFKRHSTYALFYDTDPGLGTLRKVNSQIGATGPDSVVTFENASYLIDERTVYRVQNLLFTDIGKNLNLRVRRQSVVFGSTNQDFITNFGPRIFCVIYTGRVVPYEYYAFNSEIDAWTQYIFTEQPERFYRVISTTNFEDDIASKAGSPNLYVFSPFRTDDSAFGDYNGGTAVKVQTKRYSGGTPASKYKRLFWWGMDINCTNGSTVTMQAISTNLNNGVADVITGNGLISFLKAFTSYRFRYIEFLITSSALRLTILPGVALISGDKSKVDASVNA